LSNGARAALVWIVPFLLAACGEAATPRKPRDSRWESVFFPSIDERAHACGLFPLRHTGSGERATPPADSCEIRVWAGFGLQGYPEGGHPIEGLSLSRNGDRFSGTRFPRAPGEVKVAPASGWPMFWRRLEDSGIFDLPDSSELPGYRDGLDGIAYVVEYRHGGLHGEYRAYQYWNPAHQDLPEAKQFVRLLDLLRKETGFDERP
jgi:hypothetical protein